MRIGVVSDTHNHLVNVARIVELLNAARVERVVHTGDITQAKTLHALARLEAPLVGVYGNNDVERESLTHAAVELGFEFVEPPLRLTWAGRRSSSCTTRSISRTTAVSRWRSTATTTGACASSATARSSSTPASARGTCPVTTGSACSTS